MSSGTTLPPETRAFLTALGIGQPGDDALWLEALTHGSFGAARNYERLEFLGDRVLGLVIADWLYEQPDQAEGQLSQRLNALVSRAMCARAFSAKAAWSATQSLANTGKSTLPSSTLEARTEMPSTVTPPIVKLESSMRLG